MDYPAIMLTAIAYLIGGIPVGYLLARARGVNLFEVGSGNIGAPNVLRALGLKLGLAAWLGDVAKGLLAVSLARWAHQPEAALAAAGVAVVVGHCISPYLCFRGGKGIATSLGVLLATDWHVGLAAFAVWLVLIFAWRIVSLASVAATLSILPFGQLLHDTPAYLLMTGALTCLVLVRHHENVDRLLRGEEKPMGSRRPPAEAAADPDPHA